MAVKALMILSPESVSSIIDRSIPICFWPLSDVLLRLLPI